MEEEILFTETQRFKQWWLWLILLGTNGLVAFGIIKQVVFGKQFGENPTSNVELLLVFAIPIIITILMFLLKLETVIKTDGIYVRFFPIHFRYKKYSWEQIHNSYIRKYKPILEYGGWGIRGFGKNRALNVSGNQGLQLELEEGKRLLIGTNKPDEISEILQKHSQQSYR